jgi:hypothetical protein
MALIFSFLNLNFRVAATSVQVIPGTLGSESASHPGIAAWLDLWLIRVVPNLSWPRNSQTIELRLETAGSLAYASPRPGGNERSTPAAVRAQLEYHGLECQQ